MRRQLSKVAGILYLRDDGGCRFVVDFVLEIFELAKTSVVL